MKEKVKMNQMRLMPILFLGLLFSCTSNGGEENEVTEKPTEVELKKDSNSANGLHESSTDTSKLYRLTNGKWLLNKIKHGETKRLLNDLEKENNWAVFHEGGKMEIMEFGEHYFGTWDFDPHKMLLITDDIDGRVTRKVDTLSDSILITRNLLDKMELIIEFVKSKKP